MAHTGTRRHRSQCEHSSHQRQAPAGAILTFLVLFFFRADASTIFTLY